MFDVGRKPLPWWTLGDVDVEAVQLGGRGQDTGQLEEPDASKKIDLLVSIPAFHFVQAMPTVADQRKEVRTRCRCPRQPPSCYSSRVCAGGARSPVALSREDAVRSTFVFALSFSLWDKGLLGVGGGKGLLDTPQRGEVISTQDVFVTRRHLCVLVPCTWTDREKDGLWNVKCLVFLAGRVREERRCGGLGFVPHETLPDVISA